MNTVPPRLGNLFGRVIVHGIVKPFLEYGGFARKAAGGESESSAQEHGGFPQAEGRHERPNNFGVGVEQWADFVGDEF